jgi:hypothetical protein
MPIKLNPGADVDAVVRGLQEAATNLGNLYGARETRYADYCRWANNTVRQLRHLIGSADLEALVLTRRYWAAQSLAAFVNTPVMNELLNMEMDERKAAFEDAITDLRADIRLWSRQGKLVLPDTTIFIQLPEKLEQWNLSATLGTAELDLRVIVPIIVVDELDRLKESKDRCVRWRAGYSLAVLERLTRQGAGAGEVVASDPLARQGGVTIEVVLDPPGHVRLPLPDDEIVDRGRAVQIIAGRPVTLLTYDTGQTMRARQAGLRPHKLSKPDEPEPTN